MSGTAIVTRFAPSPTGAMHLGNARTALFNALLARQSDHGRFLLRIEDTDKERSRPEHATRLMDDLAWLGLSWDGDVLRQSERGDFYNRELDRLAVAGHVYACFCTPRELELSRAAQRAAGQPPRYSGRCRALDARAVQSRLAAGEQASLRFRVPEEGATAFDDLVHGHKVFPHSQIGDFVVRRADGSAAFFFSNAVDDAASGVTHVLRGDDHLSNTPRQLMILAALGCEAPRYGHLSLLTGTDGAPLSKRAGAESLTRLRDRGYLAPALVNHLYRLGHSTALEGLASLADLAAAFDVQHLQRSPAHFDATQLRVWQKEAAHRLELPAAEQWLGASLPGSLAGARRIDFIAAVLPNLVLPEDVLPWVEVVCGGNPPLTPPAAEVLSATDPRLFLAASAVASTADFSAIAAAARAATGLKGAALFKPLRAALTGRLEGPELGPLLKVMAPSLIEQRLARFA